MSVSPLFVRLQTRKTWDHLDVQSRLCCVSLGLGGGVGRGLLNQDALKAFLQGSGWRGPTAVPLPAPRFVPMCRAARSARAGHHGAWGADTLGLLMSPGLPVKVLAVGAFRIFIFCCPGSGSKYGPSDSETLHMEERR